MMTRKLDDLGRIVIPKEIRKNLNMQEDDDIKITVKNSKITLEKVKEKIKCVNCNEIIDLKDKFCRFCGEEVM